MEATYIVSLIVTFVGLNIADIMLTRSILRAGGREANPLVRAIINRFGFTKAILVKMSLTGVIIYFSVLWHEFATLMLMSGILGAVCIWNAFMLFKKEPREIV